jgi:hypothetical protein
MATAQGVRLPNKYKEFTVAATVTVEYIPKKTTRKTEKGLWGLLLAQMNIPDGKSTSIAAQKSALLGSSKALSRCGLKASGRTPRRTIVPAVNIFPAK